MKKAMKKFKQTLSILLAVAMVITMIPAAPVSAAELNTVEQETTVESEETTDVTSTEETDTPAETEQEVTSTEEEKAEEIEETETIIMEGDAAEDAAETFAVTIGLTVTLDADNNQVTVTADTTTAADPYTFTVEPKSGFQVDDVKAFETATPANVITVDDSKAATDNTYSIADATADFTIQVTSSAVAAVTTYNVTVTKDANVTDVQYALNGAAPYTAYTDAVEVTENDTITLKVTVDANYVPTVKNGSTDVNVTADGNNVYTTDAVTVTDNTTLDITTALVQYAVTVDNQDTTNVTKVEYTTDATNYTDYTAAVDVDYGTDITLRLTANEGFQPVVKNGQAAVTVTETAGSNIWTTDAVAVTADTTLTITAEAKAPEKTSNTVTFVATGAKVLDTQATPAEITAPVDVNAGDSLSFTVEPDAGNILRSVEVTTGTDTLTEQDGVYTITPTADVTITVTASASQDYEVAFTVDANAEVTDVTVNDTAATLTDDKLTVPEGAKVTFKAAGKDVYKVAEVTVDGTAVTADENGVYTIESVEAATAVNVTSELDETKCNVLNFAVKGLTTSYTATVDAKAYAAGDTILTDKNNATVTLTATKGYEIKEVKLNDTVIEPTQDGGADYLVDFTAENARVSTLTVETAATATQDKKTVVFVNKASDLSYTVATGEFVTKTAGLSNTYAVKAGADYVTFSITSATNAYKPDLTTTSGITFEETTATVSGKTTYTYKVAANLLDDINNREVITINETANLKTVTVNYDEATASVTARIGSGAYAATQDAGGVATFELPYGQTLTVTVTAANNCKLTSAETKVGTAAAKRVTVKPDAVTFDVKATDDATATVTSEALYKAAVLKAADGDEVPAVKGVYNVNYSTADKEVLYTAGAILGNSAVANVEITKAELVGTTAPEKSTATVSTADKTVVTVKVDEADAAKKLTVNLYAGETVVASYALNVNVALKAVAVAGVVDGKLTQPLDTEKTYKVTVDPKTANVADLAVEVPVDDADDVVSAELVNGVLTVVTSGSNVDAKPTELKIYNTAVSTTQNKVYVEGGTFTVSKAESTAVVNAEPTLKLKSASDIALTLTLGTKKAVEAPVSGKLYYRVEVTAQAGTADAPQPANVLASQILYIEKTDALTQDAFVEVFAPKAAGTVALGDGAAWKFDVSVKLVQSVAGTELVNAVNAEADKTANEANTVYTSTKAAEAKDTKALATLAPAYETKLGLKNKTTTIYQGQEDILAAEATFSKITTYTTLESTGITDLTGTGLTFDVQNNNQIIVTAANNASVGKHTVQVTAYGAGTMYPTTKTFTVTVVRRIDSIALQGETYDLYKADKKPAKMKVTAVLNGGDKKDAPKSKNLTWTISDANGDEINKDHALYGKVSVKNGTVTVDKSYVVQGNDEDIFTVEATAADYEGNTTSDWYDFCVTSQMQMPVDIAIMKQDTQNDTYELVTRGNATVTAEELEDAEIIVLKEALEEKDSYSKKEVQDALMDYDNLTIKSSNKALVLEKQSDSEWLIAAVNGTAKNVSVTATTTDGGKKSIKLDKLNIGFADMTDKELGLAVSFKQGQPEFMDSAAMSYSGTKDSAFEAYLISKAGGSNWEPIVPYVNHTLSVSGGKILAKDAAYGAYMILPTAKVTTITLTDKSKAASAANAKKVYTLTNTAFTTTAAPKVATKSKLLANSEARQALAFTSSSNTYDYADKYVLVTTDAQDYMKYSLKNQAASYNNLQEAIADNNTNPVKVNPDGTFSLQLGKVSLTKMAYKLNFTFGTVDTDGNFIPDTKAAAVTLKAADAKKVTFKPDTKYTLSAQEGYRAALTGKASADTAVEYTADTINANIKGVENKFNQFFGVWEADGRYFLEVKANADLSKLTKDDLTGYIAYQAYDTNDVTNEIEGYAKVTVTLKDTVEKYAVTNATTILQKAPTVTKAVVNFRTAKYPAMAAYAYAESDAFQVATVDKDSIVLNSVAGVEITAKTYDVPLWVVPSSSFYIGELDTLQEVVDTAGDTDKAAAQKALDAAIQQYGVALTTKLTVVEANTAGIKVDKKELTKSFSTYSYANAETDRYAGYYTAVSRFSQTVQDSIKGITDDNGLIEYDWNEWTVGGIGGSIVAKLDKAAWEAAADAEGAAVTYGGVIPKVTATVTFASGKTQELEFKYTMPSNNMSETKKAQTFAEAKAVITGYDWKTVKMFSWRDMEQDDIEVDAYNAVLSVLDRLEAEGKLRRESDMNLAWMSTDDMQLSIADSEMPSGLAPGFVKVTVPTLNMSVEEAQRTETVEVTLTLPQLKTVPHDLQQLVDDFANSGKEYPDNTVNAAMIAADARAAVGELPSNLRLRVTEDTEARVPATDKQAGSVSGTIEVYDITDIDIYAPSYTKSFTFAITKLTTLAENKTAVEAALTEMGKTATNATTKEMIEKVINDAITNKDVVFAWNPVKDTAEGAADDAMVDDFTITPATEQAAGSIVGNGTLTNPSSAVDAAASEDVEVKFTIAQLKSAAEAVEAVKAAVLGTDDTNAALAVLVASNDADTVKKAVLAAAQRALAGEDYTVDYAKEDAFVFTPATYKADGAISFTLEVKGMDGAVVTDGTITAENVAVAKRNELQTLADAKADIEEALNAFPADNNTNADAVLAAANAVVVNADITVAHKQVDTQNDFTKEDATVVAAGSITGTLVLTKDGEDDVEVAYEFIIEKLPQTKPQAKTAIESVLNVLTVTNDDTQASVEAAVKAEIAQVVDLTTFKADVTVMITNAELNQDGKVEITVELTDTTNGTDTAENISKEITLVVEQTAEEAEQAITDFLAESTGDDGYAITIEGDVADLAAAKAAVLTAVQTVVKTSVYTVDWEANPTFTATEQDDASNDVAGTVSGTLTMTYTESGNQQTVQISVTDVKVACAKG